MAVVSMECMEFQSGQRNMQRGIADGRVLPELDVMMNRGAIPYTELRRVILY